MAHEMTPSAAPVAANVPAAQPDVTQLLIGSSAGSREALDALFPLVYGELRRLANSYLGREDTGHTLQPTALVHEAYLRLVDQRHVDWRNRAQFFGLAAEMMRRILVNHAQARSAAKRGGGITHVALDQAVSFAEERDIDLVALDEALSGLAALDARQARIVEIRFFGGLTIEETAEVLGLSPATVKRDWSTAKAWLHRALRPV
jgi:RNA polymerase sigma factor (TIGR02999 family)